MFIVASINIRENTEENIKKIILAGADILRFNFGYVTKNEDLKTIIDSQQFIDDLNANVKILVGLPSNKVRLGNFDQQNLLVKENEEITLKSATHSEDTKIFLPINYEKIGLKLKENQTLIFGNGEISASVIRILDENTVIIRIQNNGYLQPEKSCHNFVLSDTEYLNLIEQKIPLLELINPDFIALPFLNEELNNKILNLLNNLGNKTKIIITIVNKKAVKNLNAICSNNEYCAIMLDRGKIAVNMPFEQMGIIQKLIIVSAKKFNKPIYISTQILESTINNFIPAKSEVADLTNMVIDGVSGIILCKETDVGNRPAYTISVAKKIIYETEKYKNEL